ncbi:DUF1648 domain-containing protein [Collinsella sp. AGMB00827]|uniref:DUF1648 domain-containing protein n=1 Tax=Collinsella ureilytica TaxID=2869515 RepID=A0ABS7MJD6_9ACTN|nr:DUF1648 domain-containing protein [Collinsella urealyticum]
MFAFGKRGGIMAMVLIVLAFIPMVAAALIVPGLAESVPMRIAQDGEVLRWGSRFELLLLPVLCLLLSLATLASGKKSASALNDEPSMAVMTFERFMRNGIITALILNAANAYMLYMVITGHGLGF